MTIRNHPLTIFTLACSLAISVAACTTQPSQQATGALSGAGAAAPSAIVESAPGAGACGAQITRLRQVLRQDLDMGQVGDGVYKGMVPHIERAAAKCRAGDQSGALAILASVKKNNGYY